MSSPESAIEFFWPRHSANVPGVFATDSPAGDEETWRIVQNDIVDPSTCFIYKVRCDVNLACILDHRGNQFCIDFFSIRAFHTKQPSPFQSKFTGWSAVSNSSRLDRFNILSSAPLKTQACFRFASRRRNVSWHRPPHISTTRSAKLTWVADSDRAHQIGLGCTQNASFTYLNRKPRCHIMIPDEGSTCKWYQPAI